LRRLRSVHRVRDRRRRVRRSPYCIEPGLGQRHSVLLLLGCRLRRVAMDVRRSFEFPSVAGRRPF
jgi:hypothetical protein